jgi:3D (Asp-Asp-Asp) domain-containing protein
MPVFPTRTMRRLALALLAIAAALALAVAPQAQAKPLGKPTWLTKVRITEYFPAPERWFVGARVRTPGLDRRSRIDWLYSARGISMQGEGIGTDGRKYHIDSVGSSGWITERGRRARFGVGGIFAPFWRAGGFWENRAGSVTFPLDGGGWYAGAGKRYVSPAGISFARGAARSLRAYRSVAVDPLLIPLGSLVYVPAYRPLNGDGWFRAEDTGSAIKGRHLDVYRRPPKSPADTGRYLKGRRVFVVPKEDIETYVRGARASAAHSAGGRPAVPRRLLEHTPR